MRVYLDHAASTPLKPAVAVAMQPYLTDFALMANPSSSHAEGRAARAELERLCAAAALHFACEPRELIFNSGGTEGDNHAVLGVVRAELARGNRRPRIAVSALEHEAVVQAAQFGRELGAEIEAIRCDSTGVVQPEAVRATLRRFAPQLVCVMAVNNEIGTLQPVGLIAELCLEFGATYHCDAVRAVGHGLPAIQTDARVRLLNCTGHKFGGPRGVGLLVSRSVAAGSRVAPLIVGGGQESGARAGTENLAGIAGLVEALALATPAEAQELERLRVGLEETLRERWPDCRIHGSDAPRATGVTSVAFPGCSGLELAAGLDTRGISVGVGSACHSGTGGVSSPTLAAMGVDPELAAGTLRVSLGWSTTEEHVQRLLEALTELL